MQNKIAYFFRKLFDKAKFRVISSFIVVLSIFILIFFFIYPATTLIRGAQQQAIDEYGNPKSKGEKIINEKLKSLGISVRYKIQDSSKQEVTTFEMAINDNEIDTFEIPNTCAEYNEKIINEFQSIGVIDNVPMFFFVKYDDKSIKSLSDLKGKTIAYRLLPKKGVSNFDDDGKYLSPYSIEFLLGEILETAGITSKNTKFINTYPQPVSSKIDADVYWSMYWPQVSTLYADVMDDLINKRLKILKISDLEGLSEHIRCINIKKLPAGAVDYQFNIPSSDLEIIYVTGSVLVRKNLDPSLVSALSESYKDALNKPGKQDGLPLFDKTESFSPNPVAQEFYLKGNNIFHDYLSPSLYAFLVKILFVLVPLLTIVLPLVNNIPNIYMLYIKKEITKFYNELGFIENNYQLVDDELKHQYIQRLDVIDERLQKLKFIFMHNQFVQDIYTAREHVELVKNKITTHN